MGWDNASTIATEVERPQRTYPRAMLVAVCIVAVNLHPALCRDVDHRPEIDRVGNWLVGRHRRD